MNKEEIEKQIFQCKTKEDFKQLDKEIIKYAEKTGDIPGAHFLWNNLFMWEESLDRKKFREENE